MWSRLTLWSRALTFKYCLTSMEGANVTPFVAALQVYQLPISPSDVLPRHSSNFLRYFLISSICGSRIMILSRHACRPARPPAICLAALRRKRYSWSAAPQMLSRILSRLLHATSSPLNLIQSPLTLSLFIFQN